MAFKPLLLDSTGQEIKEAIIASTNGLGEKVEAQLRKQNALLEVIARDSTKALASDWAGVQQLTRDGFAPEIFDYGDKFVDVWKDTAAENKEYNFPWRVNHFDNVELAGGTTLPGMFLQAHFASPFGVQFSQCQAFYYAEEGLPAGTYHLTNNDVTWGDNCKPGSYSFTLTQPVPKGGKLAGFKYMPDSKMESWQVSSYNADSKTIIETVSVISGALGTKLGDWPRYYDGTSNINGIQRTAYGHNRWATSALRQYLNSDKGKGEWWTPQSKFDIAPTELATKAGFLTGLPEGLKAILKAVKVVTYCNTVDGDDKAQGSDVTYDKVFLPSLEQMYVKPQVAGEGNAHEYWKRVAGTSEPLAQYGTCPQYIHYGADNNSSPCGVRLRSAYRGYSSSTWYVSSSGSVGGNGASTSHRFAPLVVIC
jgi:hypothetical protein